MKFRYKALDSVGRRTKGAIEALNKDAALRLLSEQSLDVYKINALPPQVTLPKLGRRLNAKDHARFIRQLAILLKSGVDLPDALLSLSRGYSHPVIAASVSNVLRDLRTGERFSNALTERFPDMPAYVGKLSELGETTGKLAESLDDAAARLEFNESLRQDIKSALAYPSFLAVVGTFLVTLMFIFVVPRFANLIGDNKEDVPAISRVVIGAGSWLSENVVLFFSLLVLAIGVFLYGMRSGKLKQVIANVSEKTPVIGAMLRRAQLGVWAGTVGIALKNGADLMQALRLGEGAVTSARLRSGLVIVRSRIRKGQNLDVILGEEITDFDPLAVEMIRTGQASGQLSEMLTFIANLQEDDTRQRATRLSAIAEPIAILLISAVVGTVVIAIVLAMTSVYDFAV